MKLKLQHFGHLMRGADSLEDPNAGKDWRQKEKGWERIRWLGSITDSMNMNLSKLWETAEGRGAWYSQTMGFWRAQHGLATEQQQ